MFMNKISFDCGGARIFADVEVDFFVGHNIQLTENTQTTNDDDPSENIFQTKTKQNRIALRGFASLLIPEMVGDFRKFSTSLLRIIETIFGE